VANRQRKTAALAVPALNLFSSKEEYMKLIKSLVLGAALFASSGFVWAADQFVPLLSYRVGPYGSNGTSFFGGMIDYMNLVNMNGGINGKTAKQNITHHVVSNATNA
jgi:hypothetical protein